MGRRSVLAVVAGAAVTAAAGAVVLLAPVSAQAAESVFYVDPQTQAARWVAQNEDRLPLDDVSLLVEEHADSDVGDFPFAAPAAASTAARPASPARAAIPLAVAPPPAAASDKVPAVCPHCQTRYRVRPDMVGRTVQCKTCQQPFSVQAAAQ